MLSRPQAVDHRRYREDWRLLAIVVIELNNSREGGRRLLVARSSSIRRERCGTDAARLLRVGDRQDPRPTLPDRASCLVILDARHTSINVDGVNLIPKLFTTHNRERAIGECIALTLVAAVSSSNFLRSRLGREEVVRRRRVEDAPLIPHHIAIKHIVHGSNLAAPVGVEKHDPAVIVVIPKILGHRGPSGPQTHGNDRVIRREKTSRFSGQSPMENAAPRQRGNREHDDEESPSAETLRLLRVAMLLLVGTRLVLLIVACAHGRLRPRLRGDGRDHAHPRV